jgi:poly(A) polymerase/tRNA nucleotidyltransferase (CCA-adding enzyme)
VVRFVGDAATRIAEDYLRILRFFRFFARYGTGAADADALSAISAGVGGLGRLSAERVWSEMKRILAAPCPDQALALMRETGVMAAVLPRAVAAPVDHLPADPVLRLAALLPGDEVPLNLSGEEAARRLALQGEAPPEPIEEAALRRLLADTPGDVLIGRAWLAGRSAALRARIAAMPAPVFPLQGRDLIGAGVAPGPEMGRMLAGLRQGWLDSGCVASREELLAQLAQLRGP